MPKDFKYETLSNGFVYKTGFVREPSPASLGGRSENKSLPI